MKFVDVTEEVLANKEEYNYYNVIDFWVIYEQKNEEWIAFCTTSNKASADRYIHDFMQYSLNKWKCEKRYFKYVKEN